MAGAPSWKGVKFDEFTFEVKKCADGASAEKLVRAFCASDGLTADFCQSAVDLVVLAHNQKRPNAEIAMLQDLATALLRARSSTESADSAGWTVPRSSAFFKSGVPVVYFSKIRVFYAYFYKIRVFFAYFYKIRVFFAFFYKIRVFF